MKKAIFRLLIILLFLIALMFLTPYPAIIAEGSASHQTQELPNISQNNLCFHLAGGTEVVQ
jgi:hypothetical protein